MISLSVLVSVLISLLIFAVVLWLLWWAGNAIITLLPPPIQQIARVILTVFICLVCLGVLVDVLNGSYGTRSWFLGSANFSLLNPPDLPLAA